MCKPGQVVKPGKAFMLTINNPTAKPVFPDGTQYAYQKEKGKEGTEHYQCYVIFPKVYTRKMLAKLKLGHFCNRFGSHQEALAYVSKEESRIEEGENTFPEKNPGQRSDLNAAADKIREYAENGRWKDVLTDESIRTVVASKMRWARELFDEYRYVNEPVGEVELRPWQRDLLDDLDGSPHPRQIIWIYDTRGNVGKSWMAQYLRNSRDAFVCTGANKVDFSFVYDKERIVVFDLCRVTNLDHVSYESLENLKNGYMLSTKYQPLKKKFKVPHVVVFANAPPLPGKLSADRLDDSTICLDWYQARVRDTLVGETEVLSLVSEDVVEEEVGDKSPVHKRVAYERPELPNVYSAVEGFTFALPSVAKEPIPK